MKMLVTSDLHLNHFSRYQIHSIEDELVSTADEVDVVILAGDTVCPRRLPSLLRKLAGETRHVIFVCGNHEYYSTTPDRVHAVLDCIRIARVHVVTTPRVITIFGQRIIAGTGWFPDRRDEYNVDRARMFMNDFTEINGFEPWVYEQANAFNRLCQSTMGPGDVVVTHHLPSYELVSAQYAGTLLNAFYVNPMDDLIAERRPALWVSGHNHSFMDTILYGTRYVRNPRGYPGHTDGWRPVVINLIK